MNIADMEYYTVQVGKFAGVDNVIVATTGYTGSGGYEVYFTNDVADQIWDAVFEAGKDVNIMPAGLGARDTAAYGNGISACTAMTLTTLLHRTKRDWVGLPSTPRTSPIQKP